jgi:glycosyltransferase involved in cell wall biosynthesis
MPPRLSVVVPVHNEADFVPKGLPVLVEATHRARPDAEILIVENGSVDGTAQAAREAVGAHVTVIELPTPDYGGAMREGMLRASGEWIVTFDIDYFSEGFLTDLERLAPRADVIIASKRDPRSIDRRSAFRRLATLGFNLLLKAFFRSKVSDTHGIKAFRREAAAEHLALVVSRQDLFDTELVIRMERAGARILEVPVVVEELRPARSSLLKRVPRTIKGLWGIRRNLGSR